MYVVFIEKGGTFHCIYVCIYREKGNMVLFSAILHKYPPAVPNGNMILNGGGGVAKWRQAKKRSFIWVGGNWG